MQHDDQGDADGGADESVAPESVLPLGPRRSTYVPPPTAQPIPEPEYDDDALAAAFELQTAQIAQSLTTPIAIVTPTAPPEPPAPPAPAPAAPSLSDLPAPSGPPVVFAEPPPFSRDSEPDSPAPQHRAEQPPIAPRAERQSSSGSALPPPAADQQPVSHFAPPEVIYELVEPARPAPPVFDFDALVIDPVDAPKADAGPTAADKPSEGPVADPFEFAGAPVDLSTDAPVPLATGSLAVTPPLVEQEHHDDVDETDRAFEHAVPLVVVAGAKPQPVTGSAPVQPRATPRVPEGVSVLDDGRPVALPALSLEASGAEPTPLDRRIGHAARLFWLWFAANCSLLSVAFGAGLLSLGMSLREAILAALLGTAVSFLPLGLATLAGKWSGQPTMVVSRATFGLLGNVVPASVVVLVRVFWAAVLLWLLAVSTAHILVDAGLSGALTATQLTAIVMAAGFIVALAVAILGYGLFSRLQRVLSIVSAGLVIGLVVITWSRVDFSRALTIGDGPWILVLTGAVLVFSFVGLVWVNSGSDLARYQSPSTSGAWSMIWGSFGTTIPAFVLIAYGALLAASSRALGTGLVTDPLGTIARLLPEWYPVPLIALTVLSLLSGLVLSIYSGGFALQAVGLRAHRALTTVIVGVVAFALAIVLSLTVTSVVPVFRDLATTLAVPVAAWAGIFTSEMIIRRRRFDSVSLLRRGGVYPDVNWVNLGALFVASVVGFAFTSATIGWLGWQGYGFRLLGAPLGSELGGTDLGVFVALAIGLLVPFVAGIRTVRAQERTRSPADF